MIVKTDFEYGDASDLVEYIKQDKGRVAVKDHTGRELDRKQRQEFVERSKQYGMERHFIVAPDPDAAFDAREVDRNVRSLLREWRTDRQATRYVYAVHDSQETPHAHVAVTGPERHLRMDTEDLQALRETARQTFKESERLAQRQATADADAIPLAERSTADRRAVDDRDAEAHREADADQSAAAETETETETDATSEPDAQIHPDREFDWGTDQ